MRWILTVVAIVAFGGCANIQPMALKTGQDRLDTAMHSVVLLTLEVQRHDGSRYQPIPSLVLVSQRETGPREQARLYRFTKKHDAAEREGHAVYYISIALPEGPYRIDGISGIAAAFPFVGKFYVPVLAEFEVASNSVTYLGHLDATLRERREGEFRAGPVIPLIDQAATGMIGHTWEVTIDNRYEADMAVFRERIPVFGNLSVQDAALPPWDRSAAQRLWDVEE